MSPGRAAVVTSTDKSMPASPADSGGCGCSDADAPQLSRMLARHIRHVQIQALTRRWSAESGAARFFLISAIDRNRLAATSRDGDLPDFQARCVRFYSMVPL
jgi:hypothetical protein